jgi:hypothetical protein
MTLKILFKALLGGDKTITIPDGEFPSGERVIVKYVEEVGLRAKAFPPLAGGLVEGAEGLFYTVANNEEVTFRSVKNEREVIVKGF